MAAAKWRPFYLSLSVLKLGATVPVITKLYISIGLEGMGHWYSCNHLIINISKHSRKVTFSWATYEM